MFPCLARIHCAHGRTGSIVCSRPSIDLYDPGGCGNGRRLAQTRPAPKRPAGRCLSVHATSLTLLSDSLLAAGRYRTVRSRIARGCGQAEPVQTASRTYVRPTATCLSHSRTRPAYQLSTARKHGAAQLASSQAPDPVGRATRSAGSAAGLGNLARASPMWSAKAQVPGTRKKLIASHLPLWAPHPRPHTALRPPLHGSDKTD
ncbi:uncharacterized protein V1510DRAFT_285680 [Dipodascopsis tothii]|uniref:uncharacterized protein n=1 Tax=Dipodascopsis tothii TaxID=44089 RepID=UPI0034CF2F67